MSVQFAPERVPVWTALSELYLDTEIVDSDTRRIADVLIQSPYGLNELHEILRNEVAPAFSFNLIYIAGEWVPWSEDEVKVIVGSWLKKRSGGLLVRLLTNLQPKIIPSEWGRIAELLK